jgi:SNF family Na+-dependent transporter
MYHFHINIPWERITRYHLIILVCIAATVLICIYSRSWWYWAIPIWPLGGLIACLVHRWELDDNRMLKALANMTNRAIEERWEWLLAFSIIFFCLSTFGCLLWLFS